MDQKAIESKTNLFLAYKMGLIEYGQALQLQNNLVAARLASKIPDIVLLLEHPPVLTIGCSGSKDSIVNKGILDVDRVPVFRVDRGGDITFHGPGQLIVYLILDLRTSGKDIHLYVRRLEEVVIRTLSDFSINACRDPNYPGVWVGLEKICAVGIRVSHWVTKHGFALNVNPELRYFDYIKPCGISDRGVTSMCRILGFNLDLQDVASCVLQHFVNVFNANVKQEPVEQLRSYCT